MHYPLYTCDCPHDQGHAGGAGVQQHALGRDEDARADDAADGVGRDAPHRQHLAQPHRGGRRRQRRRARRRRHPHDLPLPADSAVNGEGIALRSSRLK